MADMVEVWINKVVVKRWPWYTQEVKKFTVFLVIAAVLSLALTAHAAVPVLSIFGGPVLAKIICKNGSLLIVGPPGPGAFLLLPPPASVLFPFFFPVPPNFVLGGATLGGVCACPTGGCEALAVAGFVLGGPIGAAIGAAASTIPADGTIRVVGTSLPKPSTPAGPIPDF